MSSKSTKENFQKFLLKETDYKIRVIKKQAYSNIEEINKAKEENKWEVNKTNFSFFCKNLCSTSEYCQEYQKYQKKNKYKK